jgi:hypothetical protein
MGFFAPTTNRTATALNDGPEESTHFTHTVKVNK